MHHLSCSLTSIHTKTSDRFSLNSGEHWWW